MYDPNDVVEIEIDGFGKLKSRLMTERNVKEIRRLVADGRTKGTLEERHESLNKALAIGLVDLDTGGLTLIQKIDLADAYPWEATIAEADSLKKASASPSESQTS